MKAILDLLLEIHKTILLENYRDEMHFGFYYRPFEIPH